MKFFVMEASLAGGRWELAWCDSAAGDFACVHFIRIFRRGRVQRHSRRGEDFKAGANFDSAPADKYYTSSRPSDFNSCYRDRDLSSEIKCPATQESVAGHFRQTV